jgi:hypothetical protein
VNGGTFDHNDAIGGPGGANGSGGDGLGGGLLASAAIPTFTATLTVASTIVDHNMARGGHGLAGGNGGNGYGGGLYNGLNSTLTLTGSTVEYDLALGGGPGGLGIGGGVYSIGALDPSDITEVNVIEKNHASTSNDDTGP